MTEVQQYAGKCKCGQELDMIISDNEDRIPPQFWMIHGFCKKCEYVYVQGLFIQEQKPIRERDFIINWNKIIKGNKDYK